MTRLARRGLGLALAFSLLLHGLVAVGPGWQLPWLDALLPPADRLDATLVAPPLPMRPVVAAPRQSPRVVPGKPASSAWGGQVPLPTEMSPEPLASVSPLPPSDLLSVPVPDIAPPLPRRGRIRFSVIRGEGGFVVGQSLHVWRHDGKSYWLSATTETTGLAALFKPAKVVQTSEGGFSSGELRPRRFVIDRGEGDLATADFDWEGMRVVLGSGKQAAIADGAEDMLSMLYQLMQATQRGEGFQMAVATGRKVERYAFEWLGDAVLDLKVGRVHAWHVRVRPASGGGDTLDIWLGREVAGLPVKIRHIDRKGELFDQMAEELDYEQP